MTGYRITYITRRGQSTEAEASTLAHVYSFILKGRKAKAAGSNGGLNDAAKGSRNGHATRSIPTD